MGLCQLSDAWIASKIHDLGTEPVLPALSGSDALCNMRLVLL